MNQAKKLHTSITNAIIDYLDPDKHKSEHEMLVDMMLVVKDVLFTTSMTAAAGDPKIAILLINEINKTVAEKILGLSEEDIERGKTVLTETVA